MIEYDLDTERSILHVQPKSAIEQDDFVNSRRRSTRTSRQPAAFLASSSKLRGSRDGGVLGQWSTSFASFEIITSA